jgi:hypothetical protein
MYAAYRNERTRESVCIYRNYAVIITFILAIKLRDDISRWSKLCHSEA